MVNKNKYIKSSLKCRLCYSNNIIKLIKFKSSPLGDHYIKSKRKKIADNLFPMELMKCSNCNYIFLKHFVDVKLSYENYIYNTKTTHGLTNHYDKWALNVKKNFNLNKKSLVLDIGSNDGSNLNSYKKIGINVLGVEPSKKISNLANRQGIKTFNNYFDIKIAKKIKKNYPKIDLITSNYTVANIYDLNDFFNNLSLNIR